jgi:hypothetical protein
VHHKEYSRVGSELPEDVAVVCKWCHSEIHGKMVATTFATDTKEVYRIKFDADRKTLSDGEMNQSRNRVLEAIAKLEGP